jgi:hypothetical protein
MGTCGTFARRWLGRERLQSRVVLDTASKREKRQKLWALRQRKSGGRTRLLLGCRVSRASSGALLADVEIFYGATVCAYASNDRV